MNGARGFWLAGAAGAALVAGAAAQPAAAEIPSSARVEQARIAGLSQPAEIILDHWGIAHIYAASIRDAYFLQGYNAARDRLWEIDLWRKRGLGRLSESFGPTYVAQDRAARLMLYRGDMAAEWAAYGSGAKDAAEAFTAGVNAYVAEVRAGRRPLPLEFKLTASQPELWSAEDVVRVRSHGLTRDVSSEVARARIACAGGLDADTLRVKLEPVHTVKVPAGLNPCDIPADVLADYNLGTKDVTFAPPANPVTARLDEQQHLADLATEAAAEGSNNWVVSAARSATGRPILANDPHRGLGVPSLRYIVQLNAPGLSVIGAGEPALPGVLLGHNDKIAFGITIFPTDQEDLYVYELNPANPHQYRYQGRWEDMTVVHQTLAIKGEAPREIELAYTRHGPVLKIDPKTGRAFALRSVWWQPGASAYYPSIQFATTGDWTGFQADLAHWGAPSLNFVYASTAGDIGWIAEGMAPVRPNWDGLLPVPGDGRYEWKGFLPEEELPSDYNPKKGWFATANEFNLPEGYPAEQRKVSFEWSDPTRANRLKAVLAANDHVSLADSMALQADDYSVLDKRATALLAGLDSPDPEVARAIALLRAWDGHLRVDSPTAAIAEVWVAKHLGHEAVSEITPAAARELVGAGTPNAVISYLETSTDKAGRDAILLASLKSALGELHQRLGPDMDRWAWGRLHHAVFVPAAAAAGDAETRAQMTVGPLEVPGAASSPRAQTYRVSDFNVIAGASVRMVMDVGNWDASRVINTPGQSGDPLSPHYRDLFPLWAAGDYAPLLYSRPAVEQGAETVWKLEPAH
jgi:penicillin G amidase